MPDSVNVASNAAVTATTPPSWVAATLSVATPGAALVSVTSRVTPATPASVSSLTRFKLNAPAIEVPPELPEPPPNSMATPPLPTYSCVLSSAATSSVTAVIRPVPRIEAIVTSVMTLTIALPAMPMPLVVEPPAAWPDVAVELLEPELGTGGTLEGAVVVEVADAGGGVGMPPVTTPATPMPMIDPADVAVSVSTPALIASVPEGAVVAVAASGPIKASVVRWTSLTTTDAPIAVAPPSPRAIAPATATWVPPLGAASDGRPVLAVTARPPPPVMIRPRSAADRSAMVDERSRKPITLPATARVASDVVARPPAMARSIRNTASAPLTLRPPALPTLTAVAWLLP